MIIGVQTKGLPRYGIMWEREPSLPEEIKEAWSACNNVLNLGDVATSLWQVMSELKVWSYRKFGAVNKELEKIRKQLEQLELQHPCTNQAELMTLRNCMDELLYREEMLWLQRSKIAWLKEGDRNMTYFNRKAAS
jgi:hypothetical protein